MKKAVLTLSLTLCLTLALSACGAQSTNGSASASASGSTSASQSGELPGRSEMGLKPLTQDQLKAAMDAVCRYYEGTVFTVTGLVEIPTPTEEGDLTFRVSCTKDGEAQNPDRTITLAFRDEKWEVINEGY